MTANSGRKDRSLLWAIILGALVGVGANKLLDQWPRAVAGGEQDEGIRQFTEQAETFRKAAKVIRPAVVNIKSYSRTVNNGEPWFRPFMRQRRRVPDEWTLRGIGSGFVIDAQNGYVLTNNHVVEAGEKWVVNLCDNREFPAKLVGTDPQTDVAVIQIQAEGLTGAPLGDSDKVEVGDWVMAAGNPFGLLEQTVTAGIISAKGRHGLGLNNYEDFLQTDAAINQGNSGGPLVNLKGEVIGMNAAIISNTQGYQGIGFAIPINQARKVSQKLIRDGHVVRGWMGVEFDEVSAAQATRLKLGEGSRLLVRGVYYHGPAHQAGVMPDDVLLQVDGKEIRDGSDLREVVADSEPGSTVNLKLMRKGQVEQLKVILARQPKDFGKEDPRE